MAGDEVILGSGERANLWLFFGAPRLGARAPRPEPAARRRRHWRWGLPGKRGTPSAQGADLVVGDRAKERPGVMVAWRLVESLDGSDLAQLAQVHNRHPV